MSISSNSAIRSEAGGRNDLWAELFSFETGTCTTKERKMKVPNIPGAFEAGPFEWLPVEESAAR